MTRSSIIASLFILLITIPVIPMSPYTSPVSELLSIGQCDWKEWADYSRFDFNETHVPELLKMAQDWPLLNHDDEDIVWAPIHAWRVLGILQTEQAVEPLISLFYQEDDNFIIAEYLPSVMGRFGISATERLWQIASNTDEVEDARDLAIESLRWNVSFHTADRDETISKLTTMLNDREDDGDYLNTAIMGALVELKGSSSIEAIRAAFKRGVIDREIHGDLEDVEIELGLRKERSSIPDWRFDKHQEKLLKEVLAANGGMSFREVQGFIFAMVGSPQPVPPNRWIKGIFGSNFKFASEQQDKDIHRILFNMVDLTVRQIDMGLDIIPLECRPESAEEQAFDELKLWSKGFGEGNAILVNFWEEIFSHKDMKDVEESFTACTILLSVWAQPEKLLERSKQEGGPDVSKMLKAVPSVARELSGLLVDIDKRWKAISETPETVVNEDDKVGRNDPCPCGSGKKYKKCCGR